jgi:hypothetical protein
MELAAEDPGLFVALGAGKRAARKRRNVDRAVCNHFRTGTDVVSTVRSRLSA